MKLAHSDNQCSLERTWLLVWQGRKLAQQGPQAAQQGACCHHAHWQPATCQTMGQLWAGQMAQVEPNGQGAVAMSSSLRHEAPSQHLQDKHSPQMLHGSPVCIIRMTDLFLLALLCNCEGGATPQTQTELLATTIKGCWALCHAFARRTAGSMKVYCSPASLPSISHGSSPALSMTLHAPSPSHSHLPKLPAA